MHTADPDPRDRTNEATPAPLDGPSTRAASAPRRVARMLTIVLGGAFTGVLIGAPVGLIADAVGLPSGGAAAIAALGFVTLALAVRWTMLRVARSGAQVTALRPPPADDETVRRVA